MKPYRTLLFILCWTNLFLLLSHGAMAQVANEMKRTDVVYLKNGSVFRGQIEHYEVGKVLVLRIDENSLLEFKEEAIKKVIQEATSLEKEGRYLKNYAFKENGLYYSACIGYIGGNELFGNYVSGLNTHLSTGFQLNRWVGAGLGAGIDFYGVNLGSIIPIYTEIRGYLSEEKISPFYLLNAGIGIPIKNSNSNFSESNAGLYLAPALGFRLGASSGANMTVSLGYQWQRATYTQTFGDRITKNVDTYTFRRFNFRIGLLF